MDGTIPSSLAKVRRGPRNGLCIVHTYKYPQASTFEDERRDYGVGRLAGGEAGAEAASATAVARASATFFASLSGKDFFC